MELELDDRRPLNGLRFDVFDAGEIEKMIFVVIRQIAFHLRRVHSAVGLRDIDGRDAQRRKDVPGHFLQRQAATEQNPDDEDDDRERSPECGCCEIHTG